MHKRDLISNLWFVINGRRVSSSGLPRLISPLYKRRFTVKWFIIYTYIMHLHNFNIYICAYHTITHTCLFVFLYNIMSLSNCCRLCILLFSPIWRLELFWRFDNYNMLCCDIIDPLLNITKDEQQTLEDWDYTLGV